MNLNASNQEGSGSGRKAGPEGQEEGCARRRAGKKGLVALISVLIARSMGADVRRDPAQKENRLTQKDELRGIYAEAVAEAQISSMIAAKVVILVPDRQLALKAAQEAIAEFEATVLPEIDAEMRPYAESTIRKLREQYAVRPSAQPGSTPAMRLRLVVPKKPEADPAE